MDHVPYIPPGQSRDPHWPRCGICVLRIILCGLLLGAIWWSPARPQPVPVDVPAGFRFHSLSFAPYRGWESPLRKVYPIPAEAEADLALIAPFTQAIRTYASTEGSYDIAALAQRHGLKLWLGVWLGTDRALNRQEIATAITLAQRYPHTIDRVVVGNEVLLRRDLPVQELIAAIDQVRAAIPQPVTYADVWEFWEKYPQVAPHVDIVTLHMLPYWEDQPVGVDAALAHIQAVYQRLGGRFPDKRLAIGEVGWPSQGRQREDATPGLWQQAAFVRGFVALAQAQGWDYNLIEAFDQPWKACLEGQMGAHWGLWDVKRTLKFPFAGPVSPFPDGHLSALVSVVSFLGLLIVAQSCRPKVIVWAALFATALGLAVQHPVQHACLAALSWITWTASLGNLGAQILLAGAMIRRMTRQHEQSAPPAPMIEALMTIFVIYAVFLQGYLVFDPRYRLFPLPALAVPVMVGVAQLALHDQVLARRYLRLHGWKLPMFLVNGLMGAALACGAVISLAGEGLANGQSLRWNLAALILAMSLLWRGLKNAPAPDGDT